jgi:hypothetical protein
MKYVVMFAVVFGLGFATHANKDQIVNTWKQAKLQEKLSNEAKSRSEHLKGKF